MVRIDLAFLPTYNIQLISGRNFREEDASDSTENIILTETTVKLFGLSNSADAVKKLASGKC
jgi:hypothetical protein